MKAAKARVARNAGYRCSVLELLEDRALPSVQSPIVVARPSISARVQDVADLNPTVVVPNPVRDELADRGHHDTVPTSRSTLAVNVIVIANASDQDPSPFDQTDLEGASPTLPILVTNGFSAIITEEIDVGDGEGLDAEDSANAVDWSINDPRGEGVTDFGRPAPVMQHAWTTNRGLRGPVLRGGWIWLWTTAVVHSNGSIRGFEVAGDRGFESRRSSEGLGNRSTDPPEDDRATARQGASSRWTDLLLGGAGSPGWERLDRDLRQFLSRPFGSDPAATDVGEASPRWAPWLAVLATVLAATTVTGRRWKFKRRSSWAEPTGVEADSALGPPAPWPLGPP